MTTKAAHALRCFKSILFAGRPSTQLKLCRMKMSAGFASAVSSLNTLKPPALPRYYDLIRQSAETRQAPLWLLYPPHHAAEQREAQSGKSAGHSCRGVRSEPVSRFPVQWSYIPGGQSCHIHDLICSGKVPQEGKGAGGGLPDPCMVMGEEVGVTEVQQQLRSLDPTGNSGITWFSPSYWGRGNRKSEWLWHCLGVTEPSERKARKDLGYPGP